MEKFGLYSLYIAFIGFAVAEWLQIIPVIMSVLVGGSIIAYNIYKIREIKKKAKNERRRDISKD